VREWLARASRAPHDPAWIADGIISDVWAPASPSGKLDAFVWRTPDERLSAPSEPPPERSEPAMIEHVAEAPAAEAEPPPAAPKEEPKQDLKDEPVAQQEQETQKNVEPLAARAGFDLPPPSPPDDPGAEGPPEKRRFRLFS
jgi:HemY protein